MHVKIQKGGHENEKTLGIPLSRQCYEMIEALSDRLQQKDYAVIESQDVVFAALKTADTGLSYLLGNYGILRSEFLEEECAKRVECRVISTADETLSFEKRRARVKQILAAPVELVKEPVSSSVEEAFSSLPLSRQVADAYERAQEQAMQTRDCQALDTSFFLSAFLNDPTSNAYHLLRKLFYQKGVIKDDEALNGFDFFTNRYFRFRDGVREEEKRNEEKFASLSRVKYRNPDYSILQEISTDLTEKAEKGLLSPLIGRKKEMEQMAICLCRRDKNNFVLLGSAEVEAITRLLLKEEKQMMEKSGYSLHVTEGAIHLLAQKGLQPESGARAIRRAIKKWIRTPIANQLITWKEEKADIYVKVHAGTLQVNVGGEK